MTKSETILLTLELGKSLNYDVEENKAQIHPSLLPSSVGPKPPFWFRPNTKTETQNLAFNFRPIPKLAETVKS